MDSACQRVRWLWLRVRPHYTAARRSGAGAVYSSAALTAAVSAVTAASALAAISGDFLRKAKSSFSICGARDRVRVSTQAAGAGARGACGAACGAPGRR